MRLIDADALIAYIKKRIRNEMVIAWLCRIISEVPTIEAEPVRHGRWVDKMVRDWHCSECGKKASFDGYCYDDKPNYCPNCGAKMDEEADDEDLQTQ